MDYLTKTDRIDARVLLQMSEVINQHPEREKYIRPLPDVHRHILAAVVIRRRQLTAEINRLHISHHLSHASTRSIVSAMKGVLARYWWWNDDSHQGAFQWIIRAFWTQLKALELRQSPCYRQKLQNVAPVNKDSGTMRGSWTVLGELASVRTALYISALVGSGRN